MTQTALYAAGLGDVISARRKSTSFFDIFTELSLDGGHTWHAACSPLHKETVDASPNYPFVSSTVPPLATYSTRTGALPPRSASGTKVSSAQFSGLIDSTLNIIDDRHLLGLRTYDATL